MKNSNPFERKTKRDLNDSLRSEGTANIDKKVDKIKN